jgi:hypothetical protein
MMHPEIEQPGRVAESRWCTIRRIAKAHGMGNAFLHYVDVSDLVGLCRGVGGRDDMAEV